MIDEKKLIEEMQEAYKEQMNYDTTANWFRGFGMAMKIVRGQPKVMEWIPVSERLPKQGEQVIATFENSKGKKLVCQEAFFPVLLKGLWPMIAWMPLPSPWKGEEDV